MDDEVDGIVAAWASVRPDLELAPMHVLSRIRRLAQVLDDRREQAFVEHGLAAHEFDVLAALRRSGDGAGLTPGRLIDLGDRGEISVAQLETLVLDEADRMADMGFMPQVEWVLRRLETDHQTLLFSATLDGAVDRLVKRYLTDPVFHEVASNTQTRVPSTSSTGLTRPPALAMPE